MRPEIRRDLGDRLTAPVRYDVPLSQLTAYRIGGPASALVEPETAEQVARTLSVVRELEVPWLALGLGSNVLISDRGFDGVVIRIDGAMAGVERGLDGNERVWKVGAGLPTPRLARMTAEAGLAGVHRLVGVPGTVGGGVMMNAGAHGQAFSGVVTTVDMVDADGECRRMSTADIPWRYRDAGIRDALVVACTIELEPADRDVLMKDIRRHFRWRKRGTPFDEPCSGTVFRNPGAPEGGGDEGDRRTAGQLIDAAGLKGFRVGGAEVSRKHANYIVNTGGATAADVKAVIDHVRQQVLQECAVDLVLEVKIVDE